MQNNQICKLNAYLVRNICGVPDRAFDVTTFLLDFFESVVFEFVRIGWIFHHGLRARGPKVGGSLPVVSWDVLCKGNSHIDKAIKVSN